MRVAIIGAGLAGTSLAYVLKKSGAEPIIYEASSSIASGASGNDVGLYNPRFTAEKGPEQEFYAAAFFKALDVFKSLCHPDRPQGVEGSSLMASKGRSLDFARDDNLIDWNPCGALHLVTDEKKARRFPKTLQNWAWGDEGMRMVAPQEASKIAGVEITYDCLYLPQSGTVSPRKLCLALAEGIEIRLGVHINDLQHIDADVVVLAGGKGCSRFTEAAHLHLKAVRGQISFFKETTKSKKLRCTIGYSGYTAPSFGGVHCIGSTFQPWLSHSEIIAQDDQENLERLLKAVPSMAGEYNVVGHRAAVRTTSKDHFPIIGQLKNNLYISAAHGSHGILSSLMGAEILADMILKKCCFQENVMSALSPSRF